MKWILASAAFLFATSAFATDESTSASLEFSPESVVIPVTGTSCHGSKAGTPGDLHGPLFGIRDFSIINHSNESLSIVAIKIAIEDGATKYACIIAGDELAATGIVNTLRPHATTATTCSIRCGSANLDEKKTYDAKVIVSGVWEGRSGEEKPATVEGSLKVTNPDI